MAAPAIRAIGSVASDNNGSVNVPTPAGAQVGDLKIMYSGRRATAPGALPAGWNAIIGPTLNGTMAATACWRFHQAGDANPSTGGEIRCNLGFMIVYFGDIDPLEPIKSNGFVTASTSSGVNTNDLTPRRAGDLINFFVAMGGTGTNSAIQASGYSGVDPVFVEQQEGTVGGSSTSEGSAGCAVATGAAVAGGVALGARTANLANSRDNIGALFAIQQPPTGLAMLI